MAWTLAISRRRRPFGNPPISTLRKAVNWASASDRVLASRIPSLFFSVPFGSKYGSATGSVGLYDAVDDLVAVQLAAGVVPDQGFGRLGDLKALYACRSHGHADALLDQVSILIRRIGSGCFRRDHAMLLAYKN